jgi:hypothetical protein
VERDNLIEVLDERLRKKDIGVLDRLTSFGITAQYPEQAEFRQKEHSRLSRSSQLA